MENKPQRNIRLDRIELTNFKGTEHRAIDFCPTGTTSILGANRTGKTTIFDAFTWLLFGKTSDGRSTQNFELKTRDASGAVIPEIEHAVTAWVSIDGSQVKLQRILRETWATTRGTKDRRYTGDTEEYYWDDLRVKAAEWKDRISALCDESVFQLVTNPSRFCSLPQSEQREQLMRMAGDVCTADITDPALQDTVKAVGGESLDDYIARARNKAATLRKEIELDTARIDELRGQTYADDTTEEDYCRMLVQTQDEIQRAEAAASSSAEALRQRDARLKRLYAEQAELNSRKAEREQTLLQEANKAYNDQISRKSQMKSDIADTLREIESAKRDLAGIARDTEEARGRLERLRRDYDSELSTTFLLDCASLVCPTCGRPLEGDNRQAEADRLEQEWNARKAERMNSLDREGAEAAARVRSLEERDTQTRGHINSLQEKLDRKTAEHDATVISGKIEANYQADREWMETSEKLRQCAAKIDHETAAVKTDNAQEAEQSRKAALEELERLRKTLGDINGKLALYDNNAKIKARIDELGARIDAARGEIAQHERDQDNAELLRQAVMREVEDRVNRLFHHVRFTLFVPQKNGGIAEKCQANVDGVPYADVNRAGQINAGLDIIETLCRHHGIAAPIFIDNAEAVNTLLETTAQQIRLTVTDDAELRIENCR